MLEAGRNDVAEVDDLALAHHYLGLNADRHPVMLEVKGDHGYRAVRIDPGTGWVVPAGESISLRVPDPVAQYVRLSVDPVRFDRLLGGGDEGASPVTLRRTFGIGGPQLRHLVGTLAAEASDGTPTGLAFVDAVVIALGQQLLSQAGVVELTGAHSRGGLAPSVRRRVLEMMAAQADSRLTIDALAREAGLSPAHFARAFKESVGRAPHQHLVALRLERARRLLEAPGAALSDVALSAGFADQAHFTRFFKREFGVTPGALQRSQRR